MSRPRAINHDCLRSLSGISRRNSYSQIEADVARPQAIDPRCILSLYNEGMKSGGINRVQVEKYVEFNLVENYSVPAWYI
ncbi:hypothetical protein F3P66_07815 [Agrobacterium fabrum]|uniref:Uncharacterized protein n=1 Tax=Agrobacterium fabrum (strain C58 / ATCC 33970) TaxID=176299 RepID=Q8UFU9_AGRFC|nr:hypothetical protein Atu1298 [Agrobacterium fabrum str. C58]QKW98440.1 hypothetical protein GSF67_05165 [Agrobacterium sp. CGMCC 11546]QRM60632.1 hypothetical protein F3P66_07815 [Agrobacterium fabrum]TRB31935.1 hypothetical protein EXN51_00955 [Agrobacterium fabrum]